jgi:uncharacterized protein (DUF736 family)
MAKIGLFTRDLQNNFIGTLQTLFAHTPLAMVPAMQPEGALIAPSHHVMAGNNAVGMAFALPPRNGRACFRVALDTPELAAPIVASMIETETAGTFDLIWTRPGHAITDAHRYR